MSSKINLQTCEYACKSSIFQDNQLIYVEMKKNISVPATTEKPELDFVEIPCTAVSETNIRPLSNAPAAVIRTASFQIEISNDISDTLLSHILREVSHA